MSWRDAEARKAPGRAGWLLCAAVLLGLAGACRSAETASGTALYVTTEFDSSLLLTQLEISGTVQDDADVEPRRLPEEPSRFLQSGETFRVLLPSARDGATAELSLRGLRDGVPVASGTGSVQVRAGHEVEVTVRLQGLESSGDGGTPDAGPVCGDCASGCCQDGRCAAPSPAACGTGGAACRPCDAATTDTCLPQGVCGCGSGPACTWALVDRCVKGQCQCGGGAACGQGQQCVGGRCRCTPESCDGCCNGNVCEPGTSKELCGTGGQACRKCDKTCSAGTCG